jgi:hypothetical protein
LYRFWLKLACWFWRIFPNINTYEYVLPYCGPSWRSCFEQTWAYIMLESFHVNITYFRSVLLWKDFQMTPPHFCTFVIIPHLKRIWHFIWMIFNSLYPRMICTKFDWKWLAGSGEDFFYINICKYSFPHCGPSRSPGIMIWTNLNLQYIRKLSCKYELFCLSGSFKEDFQITPHHFCDYLPFEEDLALYWNDFQFPIPKDDLYQVRLKMACWFWRRRFVSNINICKYFFLYCGPSRPPGTMIWTILTISYIRKLT